jgi:hypothetical protein
MKRAAFAFLALWLVGCGGSEKGSKKDAAGPPN